MRQRIFSPHGGNNFLVGIEFHSVASVPPRGKSSPQFRYTHRRAVSVISGVLNRFHYLIHNMRGCRDVGIAHAQVDNVFSCPSQFHLQFVNYLENVGWKSLDPSELFHKHLPSRLFPTMRSCRAHGLLAGLLQRFRHDATVGVRYTNFLANFEREFNPAADVSPPRGRLYPLPPGLLPLPGFVGRDVHRVSGYPPLSVGRFGPSDLRHRLGRAQSLSAGESIAHMRALIQLVSWLPLFDPVLKRDRSARPSRGV